ncbi:bifunctional 2-keto-4-hydroxyglutarate aldolase/2-keto-3-deoxy-6-phosphogluconate aldolase [Anaerobacillus isosaccharinicus]|uniref:Bifunctional 2-keto-4-hydroxyglutarate aldolase/2-keto-3-deoxy-6-phosphogluconate aldolase n=1 Tax=Anaerobacillus isosaccharinicus TaxID=1532552 RepID=A0A1S2KTP9_9BACI|nr:bifunctional 2-keto-4-hydroxyglutarate aldolase/2-keto-3-deoxy-6-phosphogluconate aldolase [Anaerobacillus isosaccharinicus]MBA5588067.1 bifunctional 2-keto-4-hydroxyglutarate aldolase/2-keto-3-deoxy-6-phosphogluconate aldolase [Anaerobacillus isosaccharinicus]QOY33793.1 bifunctional 2-keto-4-hydroxyglutarate aldolase/2-keto-3-deoxy-6-phosphogluconate aldolase [Anaerobacillus isosaccharinicus]
MKKIKTLLQISETGIVAVVRADSASEAIDISNACIEGGIKTIEVTYTTPDADLAIKELVKLYNEQSDIVVGAGTVLDETTARLAILAGAEFIVSPAFDKSVAKLCNLYRIPFMPGCLTIGEMKEALTYGADVIKLFPGSVVSPDYVKAVKAPLPQADIMPTGGVSLDNIGEWLHSGCIAVGVGGNLVNAAKKDGDYQKVIQLAKQYVNKVQDARNQKQ